MVTTLDIKLLATLVVVLAMGIADVAWAQTSGTCAAGPPDVRKGAWLVDVSYRPSVTPSAGPVGYVITSIQHAATAGGFIDHATGTAQIRDGTSNTLMIAEKRPAVLSCDDVNLDGVAGITLLQFSLRDSRTGTVVPVVIVPQDGELDRPGEKAVTIAIGGLAVTGSAIVREWVFGSELPR